MFVSASNKSWGSQPSGRQVRIPQSITRVSSFVHTTMHRIFGTSASKKPKATLQDAITSVSPRKSGYVRCADADGLTLDRYENGLHRGQGEEIRRRACSLQGSDEQASKRTREGASGISE